MDDRKEAAQDRCMTGRMHDRKEAAQDRSMTGRMQHGAGQREARHIGRLQGGWVKDRKYTGQEEWLRVRRKSGEEEKIMKGTLKAKSETSVFSYKRKSKKEGNSSTEKPVWPFITLNSK